MTGDTVEFRCREEHADLLPEPKPASQVMPDWYTDLDYFVDDDPDPDGLEAAKRELLERATERGDLRETREGTVRRCIPLMEALTRGWIIELPADVIWTRPEGRDAPVFESDSELDLVEYHAPEQVGDGFPAAPVVPKFVNYWYVRTPPGYSCLFTAPYNRVEHRFRPFSGVVDTDQFDGFVHCPVLWTADADEGILEKGTPLVQVVPFRRDADLTDATVGTLDAEEEDRIRRLSDEMGDHPEPGWYRDEVWDPKRSTRNVPDE